MNQVKENQMKQETVERRDLETLLDIQNLDIEIVMETENDGSVLSELMNFKTSEAKNDELCSIFNRLFLLRKKRQKIAMEMEGDFLNRYETLKRKKGLIIAVVPVENSVCQGCNNSIPKPKLFLMRKENSISTCPHCNRFIYVSE
ncbi:MAG: hypothetical protein P9M03_02690 [Candidatus Theseobacter exili]|nr:hypothetical protein [Candidatus Theseobacter exili]